MDALDPPEESLISLLDDTELLVATALSVSDGMLAPEELAAVLDQSITAVQDAIGVLTRMGLVREGADGSPTIGHAILGDHLRSAYPGERRRQLHASVAAALEQSGVDPAFVLDHIEAAADPALALHGVRLCLSRCRSCLLIGETEDALGFLDRADRLIRMV